MAYLNVAAYLFKQLDCLPDLQKQIHDRCLKRALKGSVLLAPEGINLFLAGRGENIYSFLQKLRQDKRFTNLVVKESLSEYVPFQRLQVKVKKEIITFKQPDLQPEKQRAPSVNAEQLKQWLTQGHDDQGKEIVLLDARNQFEVAVGSFKQAIHYSIRKFTEFPQAHSEQKGKLQNKTVVTFCTGGIRCEKAALHLLGSGIGDVYQLEGGILQYFSDVGHEHYQGHCFVFDQRFALNSNLQPAHL